MSDSMINQITPADVAAWRSKRIQGELWRLPSGLPIRIRQVNVFDMAKQGKVPQTLKADFERLAAKGGLGLEEMAQLSDSLDLIFSVCVTEPKVVPEDQAVDDTSVHVSEFGLDDKVAVFQHANQLAMELTPFLPTEAK